MYIHQYQQFNHKCMAISEKKKKSHARHIYKYAVHTERDGVCDVLSQVMAKGGRYRGTHNKPRAMVVMNSPETLPCLTFKTNAWE